MRLGVASWGGVEWEWGHSRNIQRMGKEKSTARTNGGDLSGRGWAREGHSLGRKKPCFVPPYAPLGPYLCSLKDGGQGEGLRAGLPDEPV